MAPLSHFSWVEAGHLAASEVPGSPEALAWLYDQGIRAIITLTEKPLEERRGLNAALLADLGFVMYHAPIRDMEAPDDPTFTYPVMEFMDEMYLAQQPILIHCLAGQGRTGTLLHAYYLHQGFTLTQARQQIAEARPRCHWDLLSESQRRFLQALAEGLRNGWQV